MGGGGKTLTSQLPEEVFRELECRGHQACFRACHLADSSQAELTSASLPPPPPSNSPSLHTSAPWTLHFPDRESYPKLEGQPITASKVSRLKTARKAEVVLRLASIYPQSSLGTSPSVPGGPGRNTPAAAHLLPRPERKLKLPEGALPSAPPPTALHPGLSSSLLEAQLGCHLSGSCQRSPYRPKFSKQHRRHL